MRVGLYLDNEGHKNVELNSLNLGNPGIGGSDYWAYMLGFYITKYYKDIEWFYFTTNKLNLNNENINNVIVPNVLSAVLKAKDYGINIFIMNKHANVNICDLSELCDLIDEQQLATITFGQNFYSQKECDLIAKCKYIKKNVFVSKQESCYYANLDISKKSTYIYNFINVDNQVRREFPPEKIVTYTGSLIGAKGFHILARNWKKILNECPDAKLKVIGTGKLYSRDTKLGKFNIAEQNYEDNFISYLIDKKGNLLESVEFLGLLSGKEIQEVYKSTSVGVVNPSGLSETFCISAIEFEANGIPVVSRKYGGLIDTIRDKETGFLFRGENEFPKFVVKLLTDKTLNDKYSRNACRFVKNSFSSDIIVPIWYNLFQEITNPKPVNNDSPRLVRIIKRIGYRLQVGRPSLGRGDSLRMPFNNYDKYRNATNSKSSIIEKCRKIHIRSRVKQLYFKIENRLYGTFKGIDASKIACKEELIFPADHFKMPELKDVFGVKHEHFHGYATTIPPFYVRSYKNAYCFSNREEVFSSNKKVILEFTSQKTNPYLGENRTLLEHNKICKIDGSVAHLSLSKLEENYYHFLTEYLGRYYLLEKSSFKPDYYVISSNFKIQKEIIDLLGIDKSQIIPSEPDVLIQAKSLIIPSFINNWEPVCFRGYPHYLKQYLPHWINFLFKEKILPKINITSPKKIYISRNDAKYRKLENEEELVGYLVNRGFYIYQLSNMSFIEQLELFANASIVLGVHGAGFVNTLFSPIGTTLFELFPEYYHDSSYRVQAVALGLKYQYLIGQSRDIDRIHPLHENVTIEPLIFKQAVDKVLSENGI